MVSFRRTALECVTAKGSSYLSPPHAHCQKVEGDLSHLTKTERKITMKGVYFVSEGVYTERGEQERVRKREVRGRILLILHSPLAVTGD